MEGPKILRIGENLVFLASHCKHERIQLVSGNSQCVILRLVNIEREP